MGIAKVYRKSQKHIRGVTGKLQYQMDNMEARVAYSIIEGINAIEIGEEDDHQPKKGHEEKS